MGGGGGQGGGPNSQQAHDVVTTSMRRNDVASTSFGRRVPTRFLINQCQIITFLILKYEIIENSRIELRGIVLPVQVGGLLGGPKGMLAPPLKLLGGAWPPPGPASSYAYVTDWQHPDFLDRYCVSVHCLFSIPLSQLFVSPSSTTHHQINN